MTDNEHEGMKKCSKCGEWKPATAEYFNRDKTSADGLNSWCKECLREYRQKNKDRVREYSREYHQKNRDHRREYNREYYQKNKDYYLERHREYRQKNRDRSIEHDREYYQKNKDHILEQKREYGQKNKDRIREYQLEYRQKNKDRISERDREYRQKNKDRISENQREYQQKNKGRLREYNREYKQTPVGRLAASVYCLRKKTGATIYMCDMTEEQKETLANQYVAIKTLEKTERELLAASGKKRCSKCDRVLDYEMFRKHRAECKACYNDRDREYRQNKNKKHLTK